jgi:N-acetylmuramoyl-L-alanine amidase
VPERDARRRLLRAGARATASAALSRPLLGGLATLGAGNAQAATIVAVRVWPADEYTRVALELDQPLRSTQLQLSDPPRLVVDLEGLEIDLALRQLIAKVQPEDPYILRVRIGQHRPKVARIVLDLKSEVAPQLFTLPPVGDYQHRLVLDLYPRIPVDPLESLLALKGKTAPLPAPPTPDPLAALLNERLLGPSELTRRDRPAAAGGAGDRASSGSSPETIESSPGANFATGPTTPGSGKGRPLSSTRTKRPVATRLATIAIDPGHGGEDPGAIGRRGTQEKDVVLRIAQLLHERIRAEPGMRPYLTREGDYFVPLATRVAKARRVQADLFVSIHADAFVRPTASGASVYVLSERGASSSAAGWLARKENASDLIGGVNLNQRDAEVRRVLLELSTTAQIRHSSALGSSVLSRLRGVGRLHKPRIEQAGFAVLKAPDIPSILVETAFISNPEEERRLSNPRYQAQIADAIFHGIKAWLEQNPPASRSRVA